MEQLFIADHVLFILLGVVFPLNAVFRSQPLLRSVEEWSTGLKLDFYRGNILALWVMVALVIGAWLFAGRPLALLGLQWPRPGAWGASWLVVLIFVLAYGYDVWQEVATPAARRRTVAQWRENTPFLPENQAELRGFYGLAFSASVGEEIIFRGFFITYLVALFGASMAGQFAALLTATFIFALSHFYQGWKAAFKIAVLSLAFGSIFLISGSLFLPILLHLLVDLLGGWLGYRLLSEAGEGGEE